MSISVYESAHSKRMKRATFFRPEGLVLTHIDFSAVNSDAAMKCEESRSLSAFQFTSPQHICAISTSCRDRLTTTNTHRACSQNGCD